MKVIKPLKQSLLFKVHEERGKNYLVLSVFSCFPFDPGRGLYLEPDLWGLVGQMMGPSASLDDGMPKAHGEVLVIGKCFSATGKPVTGAQVSLQMGSVNKTLYVLGDRVWKTGGMISDPAPFTEMDLNYAHAYGGPGFAHNPSGKGFAKVLNERGEVIHPLPNIEDPKRLISSTDDRPHPAGFAPIDVSWPQRMKKAGTYDEKWLDTCFPGMAADMDPSFFNAAPEDQWIKGFFHGDEKFALKHLHPSKPEQLGELPRVKSRCFVRREVKGEDKFQEVDTRLDTVWLFPHAERGILVYRGVVEVESDDIEEVTAILVAYEKLGTSPRTLTHYATACVNRMNPELADQYADTEADLAPADEALEAEEIAGWAEAKEMKALEESLKKAKMPAAKLPALAGLSAAAAPGAAQPALVVPTEEEIAAKIAVEEKEKKDREELEALVADARAKAQKALDDARAEFKAKGGDPDKLPKSVDDPGVLPGPVPDDPIAYAEEEMNKALDQAREAAKSRGYDLDQMVAQGQQNTAGQQVEVPAEIIISKLRELGLNNPDLEAKIVQAQAEVNNLKQNFDLTPPEDWKLPPFPGSPEDKKQKAAAAAAAAEEEKKPPELKLKPPEAKEAEAKEVKPNEAGTFTGVDLAGVKLTAEDLKKDLSGAILSGADLSGIDAPGAVMAGCILNGAKLPKAKLPKAKMKGVDLSWADLSGADLKGADLAGANFGNANLQGAILAEAKLDEADFSGADLTGADLTKASLKAAIFTECDLTGTKLGEAEIEGASFFSALVEKTDFTKAKLKSASFIRVRGAGPILKAADLTKALMDKSSELSAADFEGATLTEASLEGARLPGAIFKAAVLKSTNFSRCRLPQSNFHLAEAPGARFTKADLSNSDMSAINLFEGMLNRANLTGVDLSAANLYGVEFLRAKVGQTKFDHANLKNTKLSKWRPK